MTRPEMVRADTLDLQDQNAPSAQDHSQHNLPTGSSGYQLGPHQAAEIRSVKQERQSEESNLREAWDQAHLSPEPQLELDDCSADADGLSDDPLHSQQHNGLHGEEGDQSGDEDAEQSSDDEMMDRMSSSPSINEGACPALCPDCTPWPPRSSSLTPTRGTFNRSASSTPDSSPFVESPAHLPLALFMHRYNEEELEEEDKDGLEHVQRRGSLASTTRSQDSSPFTKTPDHFPLFARKSNTNSSTNSQSPFPRPPPVCHHLSGEYHGQYEDEGSSGRDEDEYNVNDNINYLYASHEDGYDVNCVDRFVCASEQEDNSGRQVHANASLPRSTRHRFAPGTHSPTNFDDNAAAGRLDMSEVLLPEDDPLLEVDEGSTSGTESFDSNDSSSSWATVSDASNPYDENNTTNLDNHRDDDSDDFLYSDPRFVDSGFGGECLRETEDIDFDLVYALHTFVATVEGQANATKGDDMVLLDDSNSYWWLVRLVKDQSIGYLPAEHIETPTERLARLNKHRNVDLSQAMLGDNMEKSKNPLRKAMKRRNAKTVQFAAPTYVEASDYEYDTEDEENAMLGDMYTNGTAQAGTNTAEVEHAEHRESTTTDTSDDPKSRMSDSSSSDDIRSTTKDIHVPDEEPLGSPPLVDQTEAAPLKSRKGTPRNADSFLKDESAEPRRITLTPGILRDENNSTSSLEKTRSTSFDSLEKVTTPPEKVKEDKKKKEKKQGMLSGLFKSKKKEKDKDKKGKDDDSSLEEKVSGESPRNNPAQTSPTLERNTSLAEKKGKLQKMQPAALNTGVVTIVSQNSPRQEVSSPRQAASPRQVLSPAVSLQQLRPQQQQPQSPKQAEKAQQEHPSHFFAELEGSQVAYEAPTGQEDHMRDVQSRQSAHTPEPALQPAPLQQSSSMSALTAITNRMRSGSHSEGPRRQKVKKAKTRVELNDFDDMTEDEEDQHDRAGERLSESPVEITHNTFMHGTEVIHIPTNMNENDQSSSTQGERTPDDRVSDEDERSSSPSMLDMPTDGDINDRLDNSKTLKHPRSLDNYYSGSVSDITDDDPTPTHSKPQSPSLAFQHQPGLPNLKQTPTPPPAHSAPFPPAQQPRQPSLQTENLARQTPEQMLRQLPQRGNSISSTISTSAPTHSSPSPSTASTTSKDTATSFSNASLRAWLDGGEGNDIRDMLVVIHDRSNVTPVKDDHPLMKGLWDEDRDACGRMMGELDGLLGQWLGKQKSRSTTPTPAPHGAAVPPTGVGIVGA